MQRDQTFRVVGLRENGDRLVVTRDTNRQTAEQIVSIMTAGGMFVELSIEAEDDVETPSFDGVPSTCDDLAPAGLTASK